MTPDILTWVSQNIGPITFGISGTAAVSASAFGYLIYRRKHELEQVDLRSVVSGWRDRDIARLFGVLEGIPVRGTDEAALLDAIERRLSFNQSAPLALAEGNVTLTRALPLAERTQLVGRGSDVTRLVAPEGQAAITASGARECAVCNMGLDGGVQCRESELHIRDCEVVAHRSVAGIDAIDGSVVTFSGRIVTQPGGVAIRARSGSRVVLEAPFEIRPQDTIVLEPGSEIVV